MKLTITLIGFLTFFFGYLYAQKNNLTNPPSNDIDTMKNKSRIIVGGISGKIIHLPEVDSNSISSIDPYRFVFNGMPVPEYKLDNSQGFPDVLSFNRKFGLLIPVTNTIMEHELWSIIFNNQQEGGLEGIGIHTTSVQLPKIKIETETDLINFKNLFIAGLNRAIEEAIMSKPEYLVMGMSLEHILYGHDEIKSLMDNISSNLSWATWHDASDAALKKYKAKRIGIISPFIKQGNENAKKMFEDMGYEVVVSFGFGCPDLVDIGHIPDSVKENVILNYLATPENRLDAIVQCGTNMSMNKVSENLEPKIGIPILGINAVTFWYALRENGFNKPLMKSGRLLREF